MQTEKFAVRKLELDDEAKFGTFLVPAVTKNGTLVDLELPFIEIQQIFNQLVDQVSAEILEIEKG